MFGNNVYWGATATFFMEKTFRLLFLKRNGLFAAVMMAMVNSTIYEYAACDTSVCIMKGDSYFFRYSFLWWIQRRYQGWFKWSVHAPKLLPFMNHWCACDKKILLKAPIGRMDYNLTLTSNFLNFAYNISAWVVLEKNIQKKRNESYDKSKK